jgi:hypothetical protein
VATFHDAVLCVSLFLPEALVKWKSKAREELFHVQSAQSTLGVMYDRTSADDFDP